MVALRTVQNNSRSFTIKLLGHQLFNVLCWPGIISIFDPNNEVISFVVELEMYYEMAMNKIVCAVAGVNGNKY